LGTLRWHESEEEEVFKAKAVNEVDKTRKAHHGGRHSRQTPAWRKESLSRARARALSLARSLALAPSLTRSFAARAYYLFLCLSWY
jgi:hypothetical protein